MKPRAYLDWNATAPLRPEARAAMVAAMDVAGNPSSVHAEGREAKKLVERAREEIAAVIGCKPAEVVFTSGATEAAGILGALPEGHNVYVDPAAHECLIAHWRMDGTQERGHALAMGLANGESGVITEPGPKGPEGYAYGARRADWLFLDVTQAVGRIPFAFGWSGADFACLSAHKFGGPKGAGALIAREGHEFESLRPGGGQEKGRRSGTENVIGIAGFAAAAKAAERDLEEGVWDRVRALRDRLEARLLDGAPGSVIAGAEAARLPNTTLIVTPGWKGETQVMQMDLAGFAVSAGSACSSGKVRPSRVLKAMGFDDQAAASGLRISLGPTTTDDEVMRFAEVWLAQHARFRARAA
jgi:cysteine desulfurase